MISILPFHRSDADPVAAFWRSLHPDWAWLNDSERLLDAFEQGDDSQCNWYVVRSANIVIATLFSRYARQANWLPTRFINIETTPESLETAWLNPLLAALAVIDGGCLGTWHVINVEENLLPHLARPLIEARFIYHSKVLQTEWKGNFVGVTDPSPALLERYVGGATDVDRAIIDLHNRSFRSSRLVPPIQLDSFRKQWLGQELREYVLAWKNDRLVGYTEWGIVVGMPVINSLVVTRSCWGTGLADAIVIKAMRTILLRGHHKIVASTQSNNAASLSVQKKLGWIVSRELAHTFVRKL